MAVVVPAVPGDRNQDCAGAFGLSPQETRELVAVDAGQANIEQVHVGAFEAGPFVGARAIVFHLDFVPRRLQELSQHRGRIDIVVHDHDAQAAAVACIVVSRTVGCGGRLRSHQRQADGEFTAHSYAGTKDADRPVVQVHETLDERQANAQPTL